MSDQRLFDPRATSPARCLFCDTDRRNLCRWASHQANGGELEGKQKPRTCLQRHDPLTAPFPDTY